MVHEKPQEGRSLASRYMNIYDFVCSILLLENKNVYFKGATSANAHGGGGVGERQKNSCRRTSCFVMVILCDLFGLYSDHFEGNIFFEMEGTN